MPTARHRPENRPRGGRCRRTARRFLCAAVAAAALRAAALPAAQPRDAAPPDWVNHPKSDDSICTYRVGHAANQPDQQAARQAAYRNAVDALTDEMLARGGISAEDRAEVKQRVAVTSAEIMPDCTFFTRDAGGHACWVQVSYPLAEKEALLKALAAERAALAARAARAARFAAMFADARDAFARGDYERARTNLVAVLDRDAARDAPAIPRDEAQVLLGDVHLARKDPLAARGCYEAVARNAPQGQWRQAASEKLRALPRAPRLWPMRDRWRGERAAILCAIRDGGPPRPFAELAGTLARDCAEAKIETADISRTLPADGVTALFDAASPSAAVRAAAGAGAGVLLAVLYDIDPARRGKTVEEMGIAMPAMDSAIRVAVFATATNAAPFYSAQIRDIAGSLPESRIAARAASLIAERYLVPQCPALPR